MSDLTLRWFVTGLFSVSIATGVYFLVLQRDRWTSTVTHLLHLTMSAAMILMAWHVGMKLLTVGPVVFFVLAGTWFAHLAGRVSSAFRDRLTNCYSAVMMAAMAWMYALMTADLPGQSAHSHDHAQSGTSAMSMSGIDIAEPPMSETLSGPGWITTVNWIATLGFAVAVLYWPCRYFAERRTNTAQFAHLEPLFQTVTAAGTALMFGAML